MKATGHSCKVWATYDSCHDGLLTFHTRLKLIPKIIYGNNFFKFNLLTQKKGTSAYHAEKLCLACWNGEIETVKEMVARFGNHSSVINLENFRGLTTSELNNEF